jgi:predicted Zn-dependent peptidase
MGQETNMGLATALGTFALAGGGWEQALEFIDRVHDVTPADIQRVAAKYLKDLHFAVLGDPAKIDEELFTSL